jgi:hypothetical protein
MALAPLSPHRTSPLASVLLGALGVLSSAGCLDPVWPKAPDGGVLAQSDSGPQVRRDAAVADTGVDSGVHSTSLTWYVDILPIVRERCTGCHGVDPTNDAPRTLAKYEDTQLVVSGGRRVHELMAERVSAPLARRMPPPREAPLTAAQIQAIRDWSLGGAPAGIAPQEVPTWTEDIQPFVARYCVTCHAAQPRFGAPRSLATYADLQAIGNTGRPVYLDALDRVVAQRDRMPPPEQPAPSPEELNGFLRWAGEGAPEGPVDLDAGVSPDAGSEDASAPLDAGPGVPWRGGGTGSPLPEERGRRWIDTFAREASGEPFGIPPIRSPSGACFSFLVGTATTAEGHGVTLEPILDNARYLHHMMLYLDDSDGPSSDPFAGPFPCVGIPREQGGFQELAAPIGGWFPGRGMVSMPAGAGLRLRPTDRLILQVYYASVLVPDAVDMSGIRVLFDSAPGLADAASLWNGAIFETPLQGAGEVREGACALTQPVQLLEAFPVMRRFGVGINASVLRQGETAWRTVLQIFPWGRSSQPIARVPAELQFLNAGDQIKTQCFWDTEGQAVAHGDDPNEELCYTVFTHTPAQPDLGPGGACVARGP